MPELPEVETTRRGISPALVGSRILDMIVRDRRLRWPIAAKLEAAVRGQKIQSVGRRAKYLLIRLETGSLIVHLGMSGSLRLVGAKTAPKPHDHWDLVLDGGQVLRFHDPRRFGSLHWTQEDPEKHPLLKKLAPEPLSAAFDADYLFRVTRRRNVAIKQLIMNSQLVVGVGNIYASEALFRAGISPRRAARRLTKAEALKLSRAIKAVLKDAIRIGGTTLRDYVNADGEPGYFSQKLFVYERAGARCRVCKSAVKQFTQGQRSTYWCSICQR
ncbi:MAG TPA: bifunctional DNA-formamidopyrimidine glycosylase/DNA-(apurinic or apyrimidinic site) lyase [Steroidobacteraceae bacterium]